MASRPQAFFLPSDSPDGGQRFCLYHPPATTSVSLFARGLVLYIHPFAEEINKARRMAALQSRAMAQAGYAVLQIDLLGCGDSSGDFGDATWQGWVDDVVLGCRWLRSRVNDQNTVSGKTPLWLWGLRAGCLVAVDAAKHLGEPCSFLFWQPPSSGKPLLQQFMRLRIAGDMLGGQSKGTMEGVRQQLADGYSVESAGYMLSAGLATGFEQSSLLPPTNKAERQRLEWFELSTREDAGVSPVSAKALEQWRQAGFEARSHIVNGPAFWQTSEIEDAPALIAATTTAIATLSPVPA